MIEMDMAAYLASRPAVSALVGDRLYADKAKQGPSPPYIVYRLAAGTRHYHAGGASGLVESTIQIDFHGRIYAQARDVYEAVRNEIDGFRGVWGETTVDRAVLSPPASASVMPTQGDDVGFPAVSATVDVHYFESITTLGSP